MRIDAVLRRVRGGVAICSLFPGFFLAGMARAQSGSAAPGSADLSGPSFVPDAKFTGSHLAGWHTLGPAEWSAENGEIVGKGTAGSGWLVLDRGYQDTGFYAAFRCTGDCDTGDYGLWGRQYQARCGQRNTGDSNGLSRGGGGVGGGSIPDPADIDQPRWADRDGEPTGGTSVWLPSRGTAW